ncbi:hypothetical protein C8Q77DRAFT_1103104 [Trametes polyzona]|nr:hypothetical protein C8Q77DRAFT_1103104 [Trametes polyzona]
MALQHVDDDSLAVLFDLLALPDLCSLSMTCKRMRAACMPVLFRMCRVQSSNIDRAEGPLFLPPSLWSYVQNIVFRGLFWRSDLEQSNLDYLMGLPDRPTRCNRGLARQKVSIPALNDLVHKALSSMPRLHTVRFDVTTCDEDVWFPGHIPGVPWYVLSALFHVSNLRYLHVDGPMCHPYDQLPLDVSLPPHLMPLSSLIYNPGDYRALARTTGMEKTVVLFLLERAAASLRELELPSESAPLPRMALWSWPMLIKLSLHGERPQLAEGSPPLVSILGQMPRLRDLTLRFAELVDVLPPPIWPPWFSAQYEWPDLERLYVSHPCPNDEFYAHLPNTLRDLSLRCWPRHYKHYAPRGYSKRKIGVNWKSPALWSSQMLSILRKITAPNLASLELEYYANGEDGLLFHHIASSYRHLTLLRVHRYRSRGITDVPVEQIADALKELAELRILMMHLDFPYLTGFPELGRLRRGFRHEGPEAREFDRRFQELREAFDAFICLLGPQIRSSRVWHAYQVAREAPGVDEQTYGQLRVSRYTSSDYVGSAAPGFDVCKDE